MCSQYFLYFLIFCYVCLYFHDFYFFHINPAVQIGTFQIVTSSLELTFVDYFCSNWMFEVLQFAKPEQQGLAQVYSENKKSHTRKLTNGTLNCRAAVGLWRTWQEMNEECWLGSISTMVAAFLAAVHGFWSPEASSTSRKALLLAALRRYLTKSLGQFQVPTLQVLLSGWPIFQLLRRFRLPRPGPTPESRELHHRAGLMSKTIGRCWAQEAWSRRWSCSCEAMRPVAKAAAG